MAVYTEVSDEALHAFLADYALGHLLAFRGIAEGVENSNYALKTAHGDFILTLYEKRVDPAELPVNLPHLTDFKPGDTPAMAAIRRTDTPSCPCSARRASCRNRWTRSGSVSPQRCRRLPSNFFLK
jgi:Ser/Thr protein kinase RdoA (MazF antagonist)